MLRNPSVCCVASFLIALVRTSIHKPENQCLMSLITSQKSICLFFCFIFNFFGKNFYPYTGFLIKLTNFILSSISLFKIIKLAAPDPKIVLCILASAVDAAAFNPYGTKMLLVNA